MKFICGLIFLNPPEPQMLPDHPEDEIISPGPRRNRQCQRKYKIPDPLPCDQIPHLPSGCPDRFHCGKFPLPVQDAYAHGIDKIQDPHREFEKSRDLRSREQYNMEKSNFYLLITICRSVLWDRES